MNLHTVLRLHAISAGISVPPLLFTPDWVAQLVAGQSMGPGGDEFARLYGAAVALVALVTWTASNLDDTGIQRAIARCLLVYMGIGAGVGFAMEFGGVATMAAVIAPYVVFGIAYAYALFGGRDGAQEAVT